MSDPQAELDLLAAAHALLRTLGHLTPADTRMLAEQARNVMQSGQRLLPSADATHPARTVYGFSVAERLEQLGYQLSRKQQAALAPQLGKRVMDEWRSRYPSEPEKETRWVDGAQRQVAWYPHDDASWIDVILQGYLAQFPGITRTQSLI